MWFSGVSFHSDKAKYTITGKNICACTCACMLKYMYIYIYIYRVYDPLVILNMFNQGCWLRVVSYLQLGCFFCLFFCFFFRPGGDGHANTRTHLVCCFCRLYSTHYAFLEPKYDPVFSPENRVPSVPGSALIGPTNASPQTANPIRCDPPSFKKNTEQHASSKAD